VIVTVAQPLIGTKTRGNSRRMGRVGDAGQSRLFRTPPRFQEFKGQVEAACKGCNHREAAALESCRLNQEGCREFMRRHHDYYRWVELSAVGLQRRPTVAYLYMVEWRGGFGRGGHLALFKRNGKWYLGPTSFGGWVT
jgi:hypothetical protein